jgi:hypothetical protein
METGNKYRWRGGGEMYVNKTHTVDMSAINVRSALYIKGRVLGTLRV